MRTWLVASLVVLALAAGDLVLRGLPALDEAAVARNGLQDRAGALTDTLATLAPVSYGDVEALASRSEGLAARFDQHLSALTTDTVEGTPLGLDAELARTRLAGLEPGAPLAEELATLGAGDPGLAATLARVLGALHRAGVEAVDSWEVADGGRPRPVDGLPELREYTLDLVLVSEVPEVLDLVESLVPGRGEPVLSLQGLSLRRIEPALWPDGDSGLIGPPVRAALRVASMVRASGGEETP